MSIEQQIIDKLTASFQPILLQVENDSHKHRSGRGSESHFNITLVSAQFEAMRALQRHRAVYACLAAELANGVHALALHTYTEAEWVAQGETIVASPNCLGRSDI